MPFTILKVCPRCQTVQECDYLNTVEHRDYTIEDVRCRKCHLVIREATERATGFDIPLDTSDSKTYVHDELAPIASEFARERTLDLSKEED